MPSRRNLRVADLLMKEVAAILVKDIKDPRVGFVTLTAAEISPDLRYAKVFYTVMGDDDAIARCQEGLDRAAVFIRREIGPKMRLRVTPELRFVFDDTIERANRLEQLLYDLKKNDPKPSED